jgi:hypothetical protein
MKYYQNAAEIAIKINEILRGLLSFKNFSFYFKNNAFLMKNILVHGIYLSVIAVLSFLLYDKTKTDDFVFMKSNEALEDNNNYLQRQKENTLRELKYTIDAMPKYKYFLDSGYKSCQITFKIDSFLSVLKSKKDINLNDINTLKNNLTQASNELEFLIKQDDRAIIKNHKMLPKLIQDSAFWLIPNKTSLKGTINTLNIIQSYLTLDNITTLNYFNDKFTGRNVIRFDGYKVGITPKKAPIIEGEKMEAEIFIAQFAKTSDNVVSIETNGKPLFVKDGVAQFEETPQKIGTNLISSRVNYKNYETGEILSVRAEFRYEVLPKCSRDCAKNQ